MLLPISFRIYLFISIIISVIVLCFSCDVPMNSLGIPYEVPMDFLCMPYEFRMNAPMMCL